MEMHDTHGKYKGFIANAILDVLIQHTLLTLYQAMVFMSDKAMDKLVAGIVDQKAKIQSVRIKTDDTGP